MAGMFLAASSVMFSWALRRRWLSINPAKGVKRPKLGAISKWPDRAIKDFLGSDPPQHLKLAFLMGLHTAQRLGDIVRAKWVEIDLVKGLWTVTQSKTKMVVAVPLAHELRDALIMRMPIEGVQDGSGGEVYVLSRADGKPHNARLLSGEISARMRGLGHKVTFHGLRKTAAIRLAEAGCSVSEIAAITGHKTLAMVQLYTREVDRSKLAQHAMEKLNAQENSSHPGT